MAATPGGPDASTARTWIVRVVAAVVVALVFVAAGSMLAARRAGEQADEAEEQVRSAEADLAALEAERSRLEDEVTISSPERGTYCVND